MITKMNGASKSFAERKKSLEVTEAYLLELTKRGYELARLNAVDSQCDGLVARIDRHLNKLDILIQRIRSTYGRLDRRENRNGD